MATLVFSAIGTALGGPIGGAIGALLGRQADSQIFAPAPREGPRLQDLTFTTSSYGAVLPRHYGQMRVGGTIIWAASLSEFRHSDGGGKGRPAVTSYSYSSSFAVALASRPLAGVGRIWADGTLLRGRAGDLKVGGQFRFHSGHGDQAPDPLLAAAEGSDACPAYRGLAYAVFEDLQLADFGNRLPTLSFEVFGEVASAGASAPALALIGADAGAEIVADVDLAALAGLSVEGPLADTLGMLAGVLPLGCDSAGPQLAILSEAEPSRTLGAASIQTGQALGAKQGYARSYAASDRPAPDLVRYYDVDRDYQAGLQRASGRATIGRPQALELPASLSAGAAQKLIEAAARRASWARQSLSWRTVELDPGIRPGVLVSVPGQAGVWRVAAWEWRSGGVELTLDRVPGAGPIVGLASADPGRAALADDRSAGPTRLSAFELPWDGAGSADPEQVYVAASAATSGWAGAALFADDGQGGLTRIAATGRNRCVMGTTVDALPSATSLLPDRSSKVTVALVAEDLDLADATGRQLAQGANRALIGAELIQFARAEPLGRGRWRLSGLLRGRGGSEAATGSHVAGEPFVLIDDRLTTLPAAQAGERLAAAGLGDGEPVRAPVGQRGWGRRPLFPVHPMAARAADGTLSLAWTRRARGAWGWSDGVEVPLHEEAELYEVLVGTETEPVAQWLTGAPAFSLTAAQVQSLARSAPGAPVLVRQRGSYAVSQPLLLTHL